MVRFDARESALAVWAIAFALVASPVAASLCGGEPSDEQVMECCKDMVHCNMPGKRDACCNPEGHNQTGDASAATVVGAKQKPLTDLAVLSSQPAVAASVPHISGVKFLPEPSESPPRHPLAKPLRI